MPTHLTVRKVPASSVPFGEDICIRGRSVWAVFDGETLLGVYATAKEAKRRHHIWPQQSKEYQRMMSQRRYNPSGKK